MIIRKNKTRLFELIDGEPHYINDGLGISLIKWLSNREATVVLEGLTAEAFSYLDNLQSGGSFRLFRFDFGPMNDAKNGVPMMTMEGCRVHSKHMISPIPLQWGASPTALRLVMTCRLTTHFECEQKEEDM